MYVQGGVIVYLAVDGRPFLWNRLYLAACLDQMGFSKLLHHFLSLIVASSLMEASRVVRVRVNFFPMTVPGV